MGLQQGQFVEVRGRPWLVEAVDDTEPDLTTLRLSCIADDAQGEQIEVLWDAEIGTRIIQDDTWSAIGRGAPDSPEVLAAYLRAIRWRSATAADRDLLQAPFRAGIRLDAYQLLPLRKALRLPRVNLLIADDVGLGKTVEAGLVARELLLRRRIDLIVISAPPAMIVQWKDELESKFGLTFDIIDRERVGELRRQRGFSVNPWTTGSRFLLAHSLLTDEVYVAGLRDILGEFRSRALFILDEAHHAAPSGEARYAISSQLTRSVSDLAHRFEHRLFLTATPHNGHSNSFSALLEMLDPQRFTRGVPVAPRDLDPVMVRRIKADLRRLGEAFPERRVERIVIANLPADTPELDLWRRLAAYGDLRNRRIAELPRHKAAQAKIAFVGLQQRLLSSVAAFARTLKAHRKTLQKLIDTETEGSPAAVQAFVDGSTTQTIDDLGLEDNEAEDVIEADEDATAEAATVAGAAEASQADLRKELAAVNEMLDVAENAARRPDARAHWLMGWIKANLMKGASWNDRRLIIFTEWEDTRRWLEKRLEHRLVRRLLSRFLSQGFQAGLSRIAVIEGPGAQPRVVLMGRLAVYGAGAARLHEEIIPVTAIWTEAERERKPLRPLGESGEERTLNQLEEALRNARAAPGMAAARVQALVERDIADLLPTLERIAGERLGEVKVQLAERGEAEARLLADLLVQQRKRIAKASAEFDPNQFLLPGIADQERREHEADRRHWQTRLTRLEREIQTEPGRIRASYDVHAHRLEPVGLVYLWPASG